MSQSALSLLVLERASQKVIAANKKPISALVLGAGLSGLYTALLLESKGIAVTILEARDRVGGRVYSSSRCYEVRYVLVRAGGLRSGSHRF